MGAASAIPIISVVCNYCSRPIHPKEVIRIGESVLMCFPCYEKHTTKIEAFHPPEFCQMCMRTFEEIAMTTPGETVSMFPHWKDGEYQLLCRDCDRAYVLKRQDLFGNTRHGWDRKIK